MALERAEPQNVVHLVETRVPIVLFNHRFASPRGEKRGLKKREAFLLRTTLLEAATINLCTTLFWEYRVPALSSCELFSFV